ncbi:unnamed protein product [Trifolium pratense]|uniref:Uncharacterized protein n=1 Tax=Trifolium pratense TaxID=57577 RepID=A0ACB0JPM2_TRIPR|nr:unnamed protein product [Trifolium pratense]
MEECNNNRGESSSRSIQQQQHSPSFRRRESKGNSNAQFTWIGSNRLVSWLILITLWAYLGFFVQSKWEDYEKEQELKGFDFHLRNHQDLVIKKSSLLVYNEKVGLNNHNYMDVVLAKKGENGKNGSKKSKSRRSLRRPVKMDFSKVAPPIFDGEDYDLWAVRMEAFLDALDLSETVEDDYDVSSLPKDPTAEQMKTHKERKTKRAKAKTCLFASVSQTVFIKIMTLKTPKEIWDYLKEEYKGDERIRSMQVMNLLREFELQRMKEDETIKTYADKLLGIANKVRLLGTQFSDSRIVEKLLVTVPERYEASIAALENTKDLSKITLPEVLHALQAQEQRRLMREERTIDGICLAKGFGKKYQHKPCTHCKKDNHSPKNCWWRPDAKCEKYGKLGHMIKVCTSQQQQ